MHTILVFKQQKEELKLVYHLCWGYNRRIQAKHSRNVTFVDFVLNKSKDSTKLYYNNFFVQEDYFEAKTQTGICFDNKNKG